MFGWVDLVIAFVLGIIAGWIIMLLFVKHWVERLRTMLEKALAEEAGTTTTSVPKEEALANDKIIPLEVEVVRDQYYCYNSKTNQFICQGANVNEIIEKFKERFPGRNAFFESGDADAIALLKQQLKDSRESSSSI
jgi:hypothetical protein